MKIKANGRSTNAAYLTPQATRKILECLGLPSRAPPLTPARIEYTKETLAPRIKSNDIAAWALNSVLWIELPKRADSIRLYRAALDRNCRRISL